MTKAERQFMRELQALCSRHGVVIFVSDDYDGSEENRYIGTDWDFMNARCGEDHISLSIRDIADNIF